MAGALIAAALCALAVCRVLGNSPDPAPEKCDPCTYQVRLIADESGEVSFFYRHCQPDGTWPDWPEIRWEPDLPPEIPKPEQAQKYTELPKPVRGACTWVVVVRRLDNAYVFYEFFHSNGHVWEERGTIAMEVRETLPTPCTSCTYVRVEWCGQSYTYHCQQDGTWKKIGQWLATAWTPPQPDGVLVAGWVDWDGAFTVTLGPGITVTGRLTECTRGPIRDQDFVIGVYANAGAFSVEDVGYFTFRVPGYSVVRVSEFTKHYGCIQYDVGTVSLHRLAPMGIPAKTDGDGWFRVEVAPYVWVQGTLSECTAYPLLHHDFVVTPIPRTECARLSDYAGFTFASPGYMEEVVFDYELWWPLPVILDVGSICLTVTGDPKKAKICTEQHISIGREKLALEVSCVPEGICYCSPDNRVGWSGVSIHCHQKGEVTMKVSYSYRLDPLEKAGELFIKVQCQ